jgi:hypothetical protein
VIPLTLGTVPLKSATFSTWICSSCFQVPFILNGPLPIGASPKSLLSTPSLLNAASGSG